MRNKNFFKKNPDKLYECLILRQDGWSFNALATLYKVDRTSIRDHARKYVIIPITPHIFNPMSITKKILIKVAPSKISQWVMIDGEKVNAGRNYADYL